MPDSFGADGLQVKTATEITADLVTGMQGIYGSDIQTEQNSSDGQMIGILTQMAVDIRELLVNVNAGFDPDQAVGAILDQRVTINNIQRQGGTYTTQPITINVNRTVELAGLDSDFSNPNGTGYTVQDSNGNQFILIDTSVLTSGDTTLNFRAQTIGAVDVPINTITTPVTIIPGVVSVNNPSAALTVGQNEETDAQLRTRRQRSVALAASGYLNGLLGTVLELPGVTEAVLYENVGNSTDANGIPAHSIWLVVAGGSNADIANTIYNKISYGAGMKGDVEITIATPSNSIFIAKFDRPVAQDLYIRFNIQTTVPDYNFDQDAIKQYIADNLSYGIGAYAETSAATVAAVAGIASQGGGGVPVDVEISIDGMDWEDYLTPDTLGSQFTLDPARITITSIIP